MIRKLTVDMDMSSTDRDVLIIITTTITIITTITVIISCIITIISFIVLGVVIIIIIIISYVDSTAISPTIVSKRHRVFKTCPAGGVNSNVCPLNFKLLFVFSVFFSCSVSYFCFFWLFCSFSCFPFFFVCFLFKHIVGEIGAKSPYRGTL